MLFHSTFARRGRLLSACERSPIHRKLRRMRRGAVTLRLLSALTAMASGVGCDAILGIQDTRASARPGRDAGAFDGWSLDPSVLLRPTVLQSKPRHGSDLRDASMDAAPAHPLDAGMTPTRGDGSR